jgi:hypothetical protein
MAITYESLRNFVRKSGVEVRVYAPEAEVIFLKDGTQDTISVIDKATAFFIGERRYTREEFEKFISTLYHESK